MFQLTQKLALVAVLGVATAASAQSQSRDKDGYIQTGHAVRSKKIAFINIKVYDIKSFAKALPADKSKEGMITLDAAKKLAWKMLRTVDAERFKKALREGYEKNGYKNAANVDKLVSAIQGEVKEGDVVTVAYDPATHRTTLYADGRQASVDGVDFMKATWSIWFGNIDQPSVSDGLIQNLKNK